MDDDGFVLVRSGKKKGKSVAAKHVNKCIYKKTSQESLENNTLNNVDEKHFCDNVKRSEIEFFHSDFFLKFSSDVLEKHNLVRISKNEKQFTSENVVSKIICLGLGNFTSSKQAQYQLVFLRFVFVHFNRRVIKFLGIFLINTGRTPSPQFYQNERAKA